MTIGMQALGREAPARFDSHVALAAATLAAGALVVLFWVVYFADAAALGLQENAVASFEAAFPLADLVFAATLFATGILLLRRRPEAAFFLAVAAAQSLYLGVLDFTFYAGRGTYAALTADGAVELAINVLCIGGGVVGLRAAWRLWTGTLRALRRRA